MGILMIGAFALFGGAAGENRGSEDLLTALKVLYKEEWKGKEKEAKREGSGEEPETAEDSELLKRLRRKGIWEYVKEEQRVQEKVLPRVADKLKDKLYLKTAEILCPYNSPNLTVIFTTRAEERDVVGSPLDKIKAEIKKFSGKNRPPEA